MMAPRRPRQTKQHPMLAALARAKAAGIMTQKTGPGSWLVDSQTGRGKHLVTYTPANGWACVCQATRYCAHMAAAQVADKSFITEYRKQLVEDRKREERDWERVLSAAEDDVADRKAKRNASPTAEPPPEPPRLPDDEYQRLYGQAYEEQGGDTDWNGEGIDHFVSDDPEWQARNKALEAQIGRNWEGL